jgi:phosphoribosylanthranilate isomerase
MWVKICGNTRLEDCLAAAELGASAVGFVFVPNGKRTVAAPQVGAITRELPATLERIGVFNSTDYDDILATVEQAGLTGVQLHTSEPDYGLLKRLHQHFGTSELCSVTQAVSRWAGPDADGDHEDFAHAVRHVVNDGNADALLIDSKTREGSGGTGKTFDWHSARLALLQLPIRIIVAGGLTPGNVADAVRVLRPWGVDTSSGVEIAPGVKDRDAMARFISNARSA